jgi:hypothetical protein
MLLCFGLVAQVSNTFWHNCRMKERNSAQMISLPCAGTSDNAKGLPIVAQNPT